jgi:hypothetical protein
MKEAPSIDKAIPIPSRSKWGKLVADMQPGDSVLVTVAEASALRAQARLAQIEVVSRTIQPNRVRVWRTK